MGILKDLQDELAYSIRRRDNALNRLAEAEAKLAEAEHHRDTYVPCGAYEWHRWWKEAEVKLADVRNELTTAKKDRDTAYVWRDTARHNVHNSSLRVYAAEAEVQKLLVDKENLTRDVEAFKSRAARAELELDVWKGRFDAESLLVLQMQNRAESDEAKRADTEMILERRCAELHNRQLEVFDYRKSLSNIRDAIETRLAQYEANK